MALLCPVSLSSFQDQPFVKHHLPHRSRPPLEEWIARGTPSPLPNRCHSTRVECTWMHHAPSPITHFPESRSPPEPSRSLGERHRGLTSLRRRPQSSRTTTSRAAAANEAEASTELPSVSVVVPVFNEVQNIPILVERVGEALSGAGWPHEIIVVDDGSTDGSAGVLRCIAAEKPEVRVIVLNRNFGQSAAMMAGFDYSAGDLVVTIDGDLQNDAGDIPRLLDCLVFGTRESSNTQKSKEGLSLPGGGTPHTLMLLEKRSSVEVRIEEFKSLAARPASALVQRDGRGYDMVCGWRRNRKDNFLSRNLPSVLANFLIGRLTGVRLRDYGCSLKAYRGDLARSMKLYGELHRFLPALAAMEGANVYEMPVKHHARRAGKSKYGILRTPRVILDLALVLFLKAFRDRPIQFFGFLAFFPFAVSCTFLGMFCRTAIKTGPSYGWGMALTAAMPHLVATLEFFMGAVLLLSLGLVADLCMRTYFESRKGTVYRVREVAAQEAF